MPWDQTLREYARTKRRIVHESPLGLGLDYEDGYDAFWVLPGEPMSTIFVPADGPADLATLIADYERVCRLRRDAVHVIAHRCSERNLKVRCPSTGLWEWPSGPGIYEVSGGCDVGHSLTAAALKSTDLKELFSFWRKLYFLLEIEHNEIERYLSLPFPKFQWSSVESQRRGGMPLSDAILSLKIRGSLQNIDEKTRSESVLFPLKTTEPTRKALLRLAERLPRATAGFELTEPGRLDIAFDDGYADFEIDISGSECRKLIEELGTQGAGDKMADEYLQVNQTRSEVLDAIWSAAAAKDFVREEFPSYVDAETRINLGKKIREVDFLAGPELTRRCRNNSPEQVLTGLLSESPDFAVEAIRRLGERPASKVVTGRLRPAELPDIPALIELDAMIIARMDEFADQALETFFSNPKSLIDYRKLVPYTANAGEFADRWLDLARREVDSCFGLGAILVLLDAGDPGGEVAACKFLEEVDFESYEEPGAFALEIAWQVRRSTSQSGGWLGPQADRETRYDALLAGLGCPVARRRLEPEAFEGSSDDFPAAELIHLLSAEQRQRLHSRLLTWAEHEFDFSSLYDDPVRIAWIAGWPEVFAVLERNPFLLAGLLTPPVHESYEPGLVMSGVAVADWSAVAPSAFLARIIATDVWNNMVLRSEATQKKAISRNVVREVFSHRPGMLTPELAMAWKRCQSLL